MLTDGVDVSSALRTDDVRWAARRSRAILYWIRLGGAAGAHSSAFRDVREHARERADFESIVRDTGGRVLDLMTVEASEEGLRLGAGGAARAVRPRLRSAVLVTVGRWLAASRGPRSRSWTRGPSSSRLRQSMIGKALRSIKHVSDARALFPRHSPASAQSPRSGSSQLSP